MAPSSFLKSSARSDQVISVGSEIEPEFKELIDEEVIRTDFVIQNVYSYLLKNVHYFEAITAVNKREENLLYELLRIVDDFQSLNGAKIHTLCLDLHVTLSTLGSTVFGVSNELFTDGITWSRIIGLFVFIRELTIQSLANSESDEIVDAMYECFFRLVKETVKPWVDDHGGWEGVLSLKAKKNILDKSEGWAKNILRRTASVIGTIAHLSNLPY
uniref:Bcl-like protein n=1 Tax=Latrodectus hesperus TaxID=256737 RepID=E7D1W4_LATHE|nr:Bcl-like protein [Latrodectus hesperus]